MEALICDMFAACLRVHAQVSCHRALSGSLMVIWKPALLYGVNLMKTQVCGASGIAMAHAKPLPKHGRLR